jgi:hypothetical protein
LTIDGMPHWGAELFFGESVGQDLVVEELYVRLSSHLLSRNPVGYCRRDGIEQLVFSRLAPRQAIASRPMLKGLWTLFYRELGCEGTARPLHIEFKLGCGT